MTDKPWLGRDDVGGVASQPRPDLQPPPHWRLDAVFATERPHHPAVSPDGTKVAFVLSASGTSDVYVIDIAIGSQAKRLSTDRSLTNYWEDATSKWSPDGASNMSTSPTPRKPTDLPAVSPRSTSTRGWSGSSTGI